MTKFQQSDLPTLHRMQEIADRTRTMIHWRAVQAYHQAWGHTAQPGDHLDGCILHNSLLAASEGKPWDGIDYRHMRLAKWLCEKSYEPGRLVNNWYRRKCGIAA